MPALPVWLQQKNKSAGLNFRNDLAEAGKNLESA
jgi:hypothetical protein